MREKVIIRSVRRALRRADAPREVLADDDAIWLIYERIARDEGCCNAAGNIDDILDALSKVLKWIADNKEQIAELVQWVRELLGL